MNEYIAHRIRSFTLLPHLEALHYCRSIPYMVQNWQAGSRSVHGLQSHNLSLPDPRGMEVPDEISCSEQIFDVAMHKSSNVLAAGLINGSLEVWRYNEPATGEQGGENSMLMTLKPHEASVRGVLITDDGQTLYTISADRSIKGIATTGAPCLDIINAHKSPINRFLLLSPTGLATGDDNGHVKLWDIRQPTPVMEYDVHEDFISGMTFNADNNTLLTVAGDATLCAYDIRSQTAFVRSDEQEAELTCVESIKGGRKVVCGNQDGVLLLFSWGRWGDCTDRFPGHPDSVDCMLKIDESTIITGSSDGLLRVVSIQPNKVLGIIGDHENFPVEGLRPSHNGNILASFAHDEIIRFWDLSMLQDADDDGEGSDEDIEDSSDVAMIDADVEEDGDDEELEKESEENNAASMSEGSSSEGDSDDDEGPAGRPQAGGRRQMPTSQERFFADL